MKTQAITCFMRALSYEEAIDPQFENQERFNVADEILKDRLGDLSRRGIIHGAFCYGSASFNDMRPGSDRDLAIAYEGPVHLNEHYVLPYIHDVAQELYSNTGVHLEISCATLQQYKDGEHQFSNPMLDWLKAQPAEHPDDCIGREFVSQISPKRKLLPSDFTELETYLSRTHHDFQKEYLQGTHFKPIDTLGYIFSAPHIAARKTIDAFYRNHLDHRALPSLTKQEIAESLYGQYYGRFIECYQQITRDAQDYYQHFLPEVKKLNPSEYQQIVDVLIADNLPRVIQVITGLQTAQRTGRAHLRIVVDSVDKGPLRFTQGDENGLLPFLPDDLRRTMVPIA
jgi:hypothetical protein